MAGSPPIGPGPTSGQLALYLQPTKVPGFDSCSRHLFHSVVKKEFQHNLTKIVSHTEWPTDRHFVKILKSCPVHPKTCKSVKNRKSKIFTIPILLFYIEYRRKWKVNERLAWQYPPILRWYLTDGWECELTVFWTWNCFLKPAIIAVKITTMLIIDPLWCFLMIDIYSLSVFADLSYILVSIIAFYKPFALFFHFDVCFSFKLHDILSIRLRFFILRLRESSFTKFTSNVCLILLHK